MLGSLIVRLRRPLGTVRWRLTLLYGGLFLACGTALLAITYALVAHASTVPPSLYKISPIGAASVAVQHGTRPSVWGLRSSPAGLPPAELTRLLRSLPGRRAVNVQLSDQRISDLHQLQLWSGIALAIMTVLSAALGWVVAGRVLAPLQTITAKTRQISENNLHQRLAMPGPRDELRELADTIDGLLQRLERAFEAQRRFVANASHELRSPLAMMRATLDVAMAKPEGVPPQTRALDTNLRVDLDQAERLLESFLILARAQGGELGRQNPMALDQIVVAALATRTEEIAAKQIEVHSALDPTSVTGSETLLARMIENVIDNAVRHSPPDGRIVVGLQRDGRTAQLTVDSGGALLDERAIAELAQPFRRLGQERIGDGDGHGLGLSIVAAIAEAHAGSLELHARPQGGLRVHITLPGATARPARVPA